MTSTAALSFKPWASTTPEAPQLKDILAQLNNERDHFRNITEASLQEEIAADGALELSESSDEEDDQDGGKEKRQAQTRQELYAIRADIQTRAREANEQIMIALDMMSLLESKYAPAQAKLTMSPALSAAVPTGSLAADVWHRMPHDKAREVQEAQLADTVRTTFLQQSADSLLDASKRLEDNVRKETLFWDQILGVTDKGWNISRIPAGQKGQQRLLGVHFGFAGCRPQFTRGIAALISDSNGSIKLERGIGTKPKAIRATLRKDGEILGQSILPTVPDLEETTLEARIRHARDSVYDEELYHEMLREARTLRSYDVTINTGINIPLHDASIEVELVSLDDFDSVDSNTQDTTCQAAVLALRLLLSQSHRESLQKRAQIPPPLSDKLDEDGHLTLIKPLMGDDLTSEL